MKSDRKTNVAIACGGTGGHMFPGLAVGEKLLERDSEVTLFISTKEVDQTAVNSARGMEIVTLPAIALLRGSEWAFVRGFSRAYSVSRRIFKSRRPDAVLAMGGFTSAPPILAARRCGAKTFLHESNTIPGRANRWLSWLVSRAFVGFPSAVARLRRGRITVTGTPVRQCLAPRDTATCRRALGLDAGRPVVLVVGGSQGAGGLNDLVCDALPVFAETAPHLQWFHLAGPRDVEKVRRAYEAAGLRASVHAFFDEMELPLNAATVAISRAGASSLAELAALCLPAILVPYPKAMDDHQLYNAQAFADTGAARLLIQKVATPEMLVRSLVDMTENPQTRLRMQSALVGWQFPNAAGQIAETILSSVSRTGRQRYLDAQPTTVNAEGAAPAAEPAFQERATA